MYPDDDNAAFRSATEEFLEKNQNYRELDGLRDITLYYALKPMIDAVEAMRAKEEEARIGIDRAFSQKNQCGCGQKINIQL